MSTQPTDRTGYDTQSSTFWARCLRCKAQLTGERTTAATLRWLQEHDTECTTTAPPEMDT